MNAPQCHIEGCAEAVTHSHWPKDDIYDVNYFCPEHTGQFMDPSKTYVVEPWATELSAQEIQLLVT